MSKVPHMGIACRTHNLCVDPHFNIVQQLSWVAMHAFLDKGFSLGMSGGGNSSPLQHNLIMWLFNA
jgi:hypothetical protein